MSQTREGAIEKMKRTLFSKPLIVDSVDDCDFYHTTDIPGIGTVEGSWDLRSGVDEYLGKFDFSGKRVLEIGPASGFLTFHMEKRGAEIVCVDLPVEDGYTWDYVPQANLDFDRISQNRAAHLLKIRNAFWLCHENFRSEVQVYYGSPYDLPEELGTFDVAVFGSVLLHTQNPTKILENCVRLVRGTMIVTEEHHKDLGEKPVCILKPTAHNKVWGTWWGFTPQFFIQYLSVLGFSHNVVSFHKQNQPSQSRMVDLFTVVSARN